MKRGVVGVATAFLLPAFLLIVLNLAWGQGAGGYPDVRGDWKGSLEPLVIGSGQFHRNDPNPGQPRTDKFDATLTISRQEGRKFWGEFSAGGEKMPAIGNIASDKRTLYIVYGNGGHSTDKLTGRDTIDGCYIKTGQDMMITSCRTFARQR